VFIALALGIWASSNQTDKDSKKTLSGVSSRITGIGFAQALVAERPVVEGKPSTFIRRPECPDCRKPMRYALSELEKTHLVRHVMFACDCGRTSVQVVAEI
jgi:hypothetical protein